MALALYGNKHASRLSENLLAQHLHDFQTIESEITRQLSEYPNFDGVDFCEAGRNEIHIRGFHKQVTGYCYGSIVKLQSDFANMQEVIANFVNMWKEADTPKNLQDYQDFLRDGARWGWD